MKSPVSIGHDTIAVTSGAAVGLTIANVPSSAISADIYTPNEIHFWLDGSAPTSTTGLVAPAGSTFALDSRNEIDGFNAIATSATSNLAVNYRT